MHFSRPLIRSAKRSGAGQRSGHARSASGRSSLPAFPRINLPCTGQREGGKKGARCVASDRLAADDKRDGVPRSAPCSACSSSSSSPPPLHSPRREDVRYGWLTGRPTTLFCAIADHNDTEQKLSMLPRIGFHACISPIFSLSLSTLLLRVVLLPLFLLVLFLVEWVRSLHLRWTKLRKRKDWGRDCFFEREGRGGRERFLDKKNSRM